MLVLAKLSTPQKARLRQFIRITPHRSFAVTSVDRIRGFRGSEIKAREKNLKSNRQGRSEHVADDDVHELRPTDNAQNVPTGNWNVSEQGIVDISAAEDISKLKYEKAGADDKRIG